MKGYYNVLLIIYKVDVKNILVRVIGWYI